MMKRNDDEARALVRSLLGHIGEDPYREGLVETPDRVVRSWKELFAGYEEDPCRHLAKTFATTSTQMVHINGIDFVSTCEHHMLPFIGTMDIAYLPVGRCVGLSKFARLVDGFARRLQIQEQLTDQVADAIATHVETKGVAVRCRARHSCMTLRGPRNGGASMATTSLRGDFLNDESVKREWLTSLP